MKLFFYAFFLTHVSLTAAEITETTPAPSEVPLPLLELEILDQSLFIEQMVTARARFEELGVGLPSGLSTVGGAE